MTKSKVNHLCMTFLNDVPLREQADFIEKLRNADEECYERMLNCPMKNKTTVTLFSIFLGVFGVDRFYLGDFILGIIKLIVNIVFPIIYALIIANIKSVNAATTLMIGIMIWGLIINVWWLVEIFLCRKRVGKKNVERIRSFIE